MRWWGCELANFASPIAAALSAAVFARGFASYRNPRGDAPRSKVESRFFITPPIRKKEHTIPRRSEVLPQDTVAVWRILERNFFVQNLESDAARANCSLEVIL